MKKFTLADGDVLFAQPLYVSRIYRMHLPKLPPGPWRFDIVLANHGLKAHYRSKYKREVERERERLINFNWQE